jgi:magnesium-transporting ATPase (P-type)
MKNREELKEKKESEKINWRAVAEWIALVFIWLVIISVIGAYCWWWTIVLR